MLKLTLFLFFLLGFMQGLIACPYTIINDSKEPLFVTNPHSVQALYLEPSKSGRINPTIPGRVARYITKEKLNFYVPSGKNGGAFSKRFEFTEHACSEDETTLKLSDIEKFVTKPTKRWTIKMFKPTEWPPSA